ncbi:chemotaxis protein CheW [Metallumcola ferriviriculae]|uniref:Chemotaxis protein CheW n=1 Tax=Metallumcola ferriviriculae TaxID=3039180 RepID=A0AAU0UL57_9FIRM|nr:chemotaxis protein CheW [Desulfitibacteraceae bacterium MK1]
MENAELLKEFVEEALTHIETVEIELLNLENGPTENKTIDELFRAVHSIKGTAGFFSLQNIVQLSHSMENIFDKVKNGTATTDEMIDNLLSANDCLKQMVADVENSDNLDISHELNKLSLFINTCPNAVTDQPPVVELNTETEIEKNTVYKTETLAAPVSKVLSFYLSNNHYGLDITAVKEINRKIEFTLVPDTPDHIVGLFNMRGQVVTLINLAKLLNCETSQSLTQSCCIILKCAGGDHNFVGFLIDQPGSVTEINMEMSEHPPANIGEQENKFVSKVIKLEHELLRLIDHNAILEYQ